MFDIPRVTLIVGRTQQGKSTLALKLAVQEFPRIVILDSARTRVFDQVAPAGQFSTWKQMATWLMSDAAKAPRWCIALRSKDPEDYAALLRASEHFRGVLILMDETHKLCRMEGVQEPLELVALTGAHYGNGAGVWLYMLSQRPTSVPINVRSQADRIITFRQQEPRDRDWLVNWGTTQEFADRVGQLPDHAYLIYPTAEEEKKRDKPQDDAPAEVLAPDHGGSDPKSAGPSSMEAAPSGSETVTSKEETESAAA